MTDLTSIQASVLASEVSIAKNNAIKSNNLVTSVSTELNDLKTTVFSNANDIALLTTKIQNLCNLLDTADISGVSDISYNLL